ncbi:hypothetical protein [Lacticaseibacillus kribbianus]|uniref:hypothetical protein n=1 Tax=Lacticaseibacillus kribbianus TaxID=2926292 RepID=UPI001CD2F39D|nr:hypothetical protein [Lacticaseibacillus kribbianus]
MAKRHQKQSRVGEAITLVVAAALFTGFAWYVSQPKDTLAMVSTASFGVGLTALIWLLAVCDEWPSKRFVRFLLDLLLGCALATLIYVYMIGFIVYPEFMIGAFGIVLVLAALFAIRKPRQNDHNIARVVEAED